MISSLKMYLPWKQIPVIQYAKRYYYQYYDKELEFVDIRPRIYTERLYPQYEYHIQFQLRQEPECKFDIYLNYDLDTEQCSIIGDNYLWKAMEGRMKKELDREIIKTYISKCDMLILFDSQYIQNEYTTLEELKTRETIRVNLDLYREFVTEKSLDREAQKLFDCYSNLRLLGYQLQEVCYLKKQEFWTETQIFKIDTLESPEDARQIISAVLAEE